MLFVSNFQPFHPGTLFSKAIFQWSPFIIFVYAVIWSYLYYKMPTLIMQQILQSELFQINCSHVSGRQRQRLSKQALRFGKHINESMRSSLDTKPVGRLGARRGNGQDVQLCRSCICGLKLPSFLFLPELWLQCWMFQRRLTGQLWVLLHVYKNDHFFQ